jgi:hypothetical protein
VGRRGLRAAGPRHRGVHKRFTRNSWLSVCASHNRLGQEEELLPRQVAALEQANVIAVSAGKAHSAALTSKFSSTGQLFVPQAGCGGGGQALIGEHACRVCSKTLTCFGVPPLCRSGPSVDMGRWQ